jgi:hypothetical protein
LDASGARTQAENRSGNIPLVIDFNLDVAALKQQNLPTRELVAHFEVIICHFFP